MTPNLKLLTRVASLVTLTIIVAIPSVAQVSVCPGTTDGSPGEVVYVPILIDNPQGVAAFGVAFAFDPAILQYSETLSSALTAGWVALDGNAIAPDTVRIGGFNGTPIATATPDTLGYVCMTVSGQASSSYDLSGFVDDLEGAADCSGDFNLIDPVEPRTWGVIKYRYTDR